MAWLVIVQTQNNRVQEFVSLPTEQDCLDWIAVHGVGFTYEGSFSDFLYVDDDNNVTTVYDLSLDKQLKIEKRDILLRFTEEWSTPYTSEQQDYINALNDIENQAGFPQNVTWPTRP